MRIIERVKLYPIAVGQLFMAGRYYLLVLLNYVRD